MCSFIDHCHLLVIDDLGGMHQARHRRVLNANHDFTAVVQQIRNPLVGQSHAPGDGVIVCEHHDVGFGNRHSTPFRSNAYCSVIVTLLIVSRARIWLTTSIPVSTLPNTVYWWSRWGARPSITKNWEPALFGSLVRAIDRIPSV